MFELFTQASKLASVGPRHSITRFALMKIATSPSATHETIMVEWVRKTNTEKIEFEGRTLLCVYEGTTTKEAPAGGTEHSAS
jgi:hypothetical protein